MHHLSIAENDLVKVTRAAKVCGVQVMFPFIDSRLIECTGRLPAAEIEGAVLGQVQGLLRQPEMLIATWMSAARAEAGRDEQA